MRTASWLSSNMKVYVGNATAVRDYRVQLRGNRAILVFGTYLVLLTLVTMFQYGLIESRQVNVSMIQSDLKGFFSACMAFLAFAVCAVSPALAATTVVAERQRRSLDLVFSAPVQPKYYLVGKMIASYRYIWMLLVLSLPITATSVVLGGTTWGEVLISYWLLSMHGLLYVAIALLMSSTAPKIVSAILWSYAVVFLINVFATGPVSLLAFSSGMSAGGPTSFAITLQPFLASYAADTYSLVFGIQVPNWILGTLTLLLFIKLLLLSASTTLTPYGGHEIPGIRAHLLIYASFFLGLCTYAVGPLGGGSSGSMIAFVIWMMVFTTVASPFVTCYSREAEARFRYDGIFSLRNVLKGTPSSGLPFLWTMVIVSALGSWVGSWIADPATTSRLGVLAYSFFFMGLLTLFWSIGQYISSLTGNLRTARSLVLAALVAIAYLPIPVLAMLSSNSASSDLPPIWSVYLLKPILLISNVEGPTQAVIYGTIHLALGLFIAAKAETNRRKKMVGHEHRQAA